MVSKAEILNAGTEREEERKDVLRDISNKRTSKENLEKIKNILEWEYKYKDSTEMPSELSVSKIKELSKDKAEEKYGVTLKKPNFLVEKTELTAAEKGTIMHLCLQKLNYKEDYNLEKLKNMVNNLVEQEIILPKEIEQFLDKIYKSLADASCEELIEITHEDTAWKEVSDKTYYAPVINLEKYKAKFEKQYRGLIKVMEI